MSSKDSCIFFMAVFTAGIALRSATSAERGTFVSGEYNTASAEPAIHGAREPSKGMGATACNAVNKMANILPPHNLLPSFHEVTSTSSPSPRLFPQHSSNSPRQVVGDNSDTKVPNASPFKLEEIPDSLILRLPALEPTTTATTTCLPLSLLDKPNDLRLLDD